MSNNDNATSLIGHWVYILDGEYGKAGQITLSFGTDYLLVRIRPHNDAPPSSELMAADDLCSDQTADRYISIFDTEAELDAYLKWLDTPDDDGKPRVVSMRKD
jgi:hypothetical protein